MSTELRSVSYSLAGINLRKTGPGRLPGSETVPCTVVGWPETSPLLLRTNVRSHGAS
jgi:hypothetical protein